MVFLSSVLDASPSLFILPCVHLTYMFLFHFHSANLCRRAQNNHIFFQVDLRSNKWATHLLPLSALSFLTHPPSSHTLYISSIQTYLTTPRICLSSNFLQNYKNSDVFCLKYTRATVWRACLCFSPPVQNDSMSVNLIWRLCGQIKSVSNLLAFASKHSVDEGEIKQIYNPASFLGVILKGEKLVCTYCSKDKFNLTFH